jgi:uncharacterized protein (DUF486 family)
VFVPFALLFMDQPLKFDSWAAPAWSAPSLRFRSA